MMLNNYTLISLFFLIGSCSISKLPVGIKHFAQSEGEVLASISPLDTDFRDLEVIGDAMETGELCCSERHRMAMDRLF